MTDELGPRVRDSMGRFRKGQTGNPKGRPKKDTERAYLDVMMSKISLEDWGEVVETALQQAKDGDPKAREWMGRHLMGDPIHVHEYLFSEKKDFTLRVVFEGADVPQLESGEDDVDGEWDYVEDDE